MARKAKDYMAKKSGPTDLCGARVITETQAEIERLGAAIRKSFIRSIRCRSFAGEGSKLNRR